MMTTMSGPAPQTDRLAALRRFAMAITVLSALGYSVLGFEPSRAEPLVALAVAYGLEVLLEWVDAWASRRRPRYAVGLRVPVDFLLPAHVTALAVAMLLYANDRVWPVAFATAVGIGSKAIVRVSVGRGARHVLNPSNTGIALTLLLFPSVGIAPPYQFTEDLSGLGDWLLPGLIVLSGTFLNTRFTARVPLILGWLGGFVAQAAIRSQLQGTPVTAALLPMSGMAFLLFTFYMVTDPGTTPGAPRAQLVFGISVAAVYGVLIGFHVVFGQFFALFAVCASRGAFLAVAHAAQSRVPRPWLASRPPALVPVPARADDVRPTPQEASER
jgi:hypothetical protein